MFSSLNTKKCIYLIHCKTFVQRHQLQSRKYNLKKIDWTRGHNFFSILMNSIFRFRRDVIVCFYHSNTKFISNVFLYTYTYISIMYVIRLRIVKILTKYILALPDRWISMILVHYDPFWRIARGQAKIVNVINNNYMWYDISHILLLGWEARLCCVCNQFLFIIKKFLSRISFG